MRVLIAHAEPAVRAQIRVALAPLECEITEAGDAAELHDAVQRSVPDVTLLDAQLSRDEGTSIVAKLKSHRNAFFTAIVIIDRALDLDSAHSRVTSGVHDFLIEPLNDGEVLARVRAAARTKGLQEELFDQARRLEALIFEDPLTQLYNRRFILNQLAVVVSSARRHERPLSVVMIDIDHFKALNDRYGHEIGDRALGLVARSMRERLRAEDYLGRLGGEEFLALLPDVDEAAAGVVADSLRATVAEHSLEAAGEKLSMTVSAGYAAWRGESPEELLKRSDDAMYLAKAAGRDTVQRG